METKNQHVDLTSQQPEVETKTALLTFDQYKMFIKFDTIIVTCLALLGIAGNIVNVKTFIKMGYDDGVTVSFLGLSVCDLAYVVVMLFRAVGEGCYMLEIEYDYKIWFPIQPFGVYVFAGNTGMLIYLMTVLITTFLAVARCMCVIRPFQFRNTFTMSRSLLIIFLFALFSIFSYVPILAFMRMIDMYDVRINATRPSLWISPAREQIKDIIWGFRDTFLPILTQCVVVVCVIIMTKGLKNSSKFRQSFTVRSVDNRKDKLAQMKNHDNDPDEQKEQQNNRNGNQQRMNSPGTVSGTMLNAKERQVVMQVVVISVVYILSNTPKLLLSITGAFVHGFALGQVYEYLYIMNICIMEWLQMFNSSINVLIYYKFNPKYRSSCGF